MVAQTIALRNIYFKVACVVNLKLVFTHYFFYNSAMGIRKKICWQFYFYFCRREGQIRQHYNGTNFSIWKLSEVVIIILFSAISSLLYMFIRFLLVF